MLFTDCFRHGNVSDLDFLMSQVLVSILWYQVPLLLVISVKLRSSLHTGTSVSSALKRGMVLEMSSIFLRFYSMDVPFLGKFTVHLLAQ